MRSRRLWPALLVAALLGSVLAVVSQTLPGPPVTTRPPPATSPGTTGGQPGIVLPPSLRFDRTATGTIATERVAVESTGTAPLRVTRVEVTGPAADQFQAVADGDCDEVAPGRQCTIAVSYEPTAAGSHQASLVVGHDAQGGSSTVALAGTSYSPAVLVLTVDPPNVGTISGPEIECKQACAPKDLPPGTVTLSAAADDPGYFFVRWGGACASTATDQPCTLELKAGSRVGVTANFQQNVP